MEHRGAGCVLGRAAGLGPAVEGRIGHMIELTCTVAAGERQRLTFWKDDFYEWVSDAPLRAPDGFSETATAAGVAASAAERNEMLAYALQTFSRGHAQLLGRILSGYEKAKKLQIRGMIGYAAAAALALVILLALPLSMDMELRVLVWLSFAGLLFIPFIPLWILLCNHVLAPDWNTYATWYRRRDRKGLSFEDLYRAMGMTRP